MTSALAWFASRQEAHKAQIHALRPNAGMIGLSADDFIKFNWKIPQP
jgi:hypothetical protein